MTRDEILRMPAGKELDALIAEKVMGWRKVRWLGTYDWRDKDGDHPYSVNGWTPSTDSQKACDVVDKLGPASFSSYKYNDGFGVCLDSDFTVKAETLPLAICRAALLAVSESQPAHYVGGGEGK